MSQIPGPMNFDQHDVCADCSQDPCVCETPCGYHPQDPKKEAGMKKAPMGLIPTVALEEISWVLKLGADKYGRDNWRDNDVLASTYISALFRHICQYRDCEDPDSESGRSHLAHVGANVMIMLDAMKYGTLVDDRPKHVLKTQ